MCLLIAKPAGTTIPEDAMRSGYDANDHGAGFAVAEDGKVLIRKGFFNFDKFLKAYLEVSKDQTLPALVHFRIGTSGHNDEDNCHPFVVGNMAMAHNGVFPAFSFSGTESDTNRLSIYLNALETTSPGIVLTPPMLGMLDDICDERNKLAFLTPSGKIQIVADRLGYWDDGIWYSNLSYKPRRRTRYRAREFAAGSLFERIGAEEHRDPSAPLDRDDFDHFITANIVADFAGAVGSYAPRGTHNRIVNTKRRMCRFFSAEGRLLGGMDPIVGSKTLYNVVFSHDDGHGEPYAEMVEWNTFAENLLDTYRDDVKPSTCDDCGKVIKKDFELDFGQCVHCQAINQALSL